MKYHNLILILSLLLLQFCTKEELIVCKTIPKSTSPLGYNYVLSDNYLTFPTFNLFNSSELLVYKMKNENHLNELFVYNTITNNQEQVYSGNIFSNPQWASNNLIYASLNDENIWSINIDNQELSQITTKGGAFTFAINHENNVIFDQAGAINPFYILNENNTIIDSLDLPYAKYIEWGSNNKILISTSQHIILFDFFTKEISYYCESYDLNGISKCGWINEKEFVWSNLENIYITNIETKKTKKIKSFCNSIYYNYPSYSNETNEIIWQKERKTKIDQNLIKIESYIVTMKTDGKNEKKIDIL